MPVNRWQVMAQAVGVLAAAIVGFGCSSAPSPAAGVLPGSVSGKPKVDKVVFAAEAPRVDSFDLYAQSGPDLWPSRVMYEYLIGVDPENGKFVPQLATSWKVEPDGKSIRFQLRKDVRFQRDNGTMTTKDLVPTWQARIREEIQNSPSIYWRRVIDRIESLSDYEAIYHLKRPDGNFFNSISEQRGIMEVFSKSDFDKSGLPTPGKEPLAGTGPYQYSASSSGSFLRFDRVPYDHWKGTPDFPSFEWRWMKEASTRMAALLAGEAHLASLPQDLLAQAEKQQMRVLAGKVLGLRTFLSLYCCYANDINDPSKGWMFPDSPLADRRVRQALSKAIDRDALNKAFLGGKAKTMVLNHYLPDRDGWNPDWERRFPELHGYDQAKARALLADAGYNAANPLKTSLFLVPASGYAGAQDLAEAIAAHWKAVGVQTELVQIDGASLSAGSRQFKYTNHLILNSTSSDQATGAMNYGNSLSTRGSGYEATLADQLANEVGNTLDEKTQTELWRKAGDIWFDTIQALPLFWLPTEVAINPQFVADYVFPGSITGTWTHTGNIKATR